MQSIGRISVSKNLLIIVAFITLLLTVPAGSDIGMILNNNQIQAQQLDISNVRVAAGGGNSTAMLALFVPENVEIEAGQTISWYNPSPVAEPHTVTFLKDNSLFPPPAAPFAVPNSTEFKALIPSPNLEPWIIPSNDTTTKTVIVDNARNYVPTVIDSTGTNVTYLPPNANISIDGTESFVNSGWIWPEGQIPPGPPPITAFTVTFERPGTFNYLCTVHPWMVGSVTVN